MKQLPLKLQSLFAAVSAAQTLPYPRGRRSRSGQLYCLAARGMTLTKKLNTVRSAKDLFFPQVENLSASV